MWCPYTNADLPETELNEEHIIPLSLGGSNNFVVPVEAKANSRFGTEIDGPLANDPLIMFARREYNARGHSGAPIRVVAKKASFRGRPAQVAFRGAEGPPQIWDAMTRSIIPEGDVGIDSFKVEWSIPLYSRIRFIAKVALSAGWRCLGSYFRENVAHQELRMIVNSSSKDDLRTIAPDIKTRIDGALLAEQETPFPAALAISSACNALEGSAVLITPSESSVCFSVGILGRYLGALNVPAKTKNFPSSDDFDLGHCVIITRRTLRRLSLRQLSCEILQSIDSQEKI